MGHGIPLQVVVPSVSLADALQGAVRTGTAETLSPAILSKQAVEREGAGSA